MSAMAHRIVSIMCALLAVLVLQLAPPPPAWAQDGKSATPEELAAAREMFVEGKALEKDGDWSGALERFEKVAKIKMTPQVRFHVALCHEHLGRLVEAVNGFELAEQEAKALGEKARDVAENAPKRAAALRERVPKLTIVIEGTVYTSKVFLDDRQVSEALFGQPIPVDPGEHVVEVRRNGDVKEQKELYFEESDAQEISLTINDPKPPKSTKPDPGVGPNPDPDPDKPPIIPDEKPPQWIAYIVGGAGVAALVVGGIMWSVRQAELDKIAAECEDPENFKGCNERFRPTASAAENIDLTAKVLFGVGAAAVVGGGVLWFLLLPDDDPMFTTGNSKARVGVVPTIGGAVIVGTF